MQKEGMLAAVAARVQAQEANLCKQREELLEAQGKLSSERVLLHAAQQALHTAQVRLQPGTCWGGYHLGWSRPPSGASIICPAQEGAVG
jgi:hypothetical protein